MGKGVISDASPYNLSAARSTALRSADVVLLLGARLNWILSFGLAPKWNSNVKIIQVDISADELGRNGHDASLSLVGDVGLVAQQLVDALGDWQWDGMRSSSNEYARRLLAAKKRNEEKAAKKASISKLPMTYERAFAIIKGEIDALSPQEDGDVVYVSEGMSSITHLVSVFRPTSPIPQTL
jgi:2-hydroxyacyl-CoA lyase 1